MPMFDTLCPQAATNSEKPIFSIKVKFKVTRSFQRASLVEYVCKYEVSHYQGSKVIVNVKTDGQDKNNMPPII